MYILHLVLKTNEWKLHVVSMHAGMPTSVRCSELLRPRGSSVLRDAFPRAPRLAVCHVQQTGYRPLRDGHVPQVPPGTLCLHVLPEPAQQGHVQRTEQQAVLPAVFSPSVQLRAFIWANFTCCTSWVCVCQRTLCWQLICRILAGGYSRIAGVGLRFLPGLGLWLVLTLLCPLIDICSHNMMYYFPSFRQRPLFYMCLALSV